MAAVTQNPNEEMGMGQWWPFDSDFGQSRSLQPGDKRTRVLKRGQTTFTGHGICSDSKALIHAAIVLA